MKDPILSLLRSVLTLCGAILIQKGYLDESTVNDVAGGLVMLIGIVWGAIDAKRKAATIQSLTATVSSLRK